MAFTKAQLEALKNSLLASNQPILASQHRQQVQSIIDEMYDAQSRANILVGVQSDTVQGGSDTFLVFRSGQAFQLPVSLLNANDLANLGDVFINNLEDGDSLVYDAVADRWENRSILLGFALSNLTDVELTSLAGGDILRYDSGDDLWKNVSLASLLAPYVTLDTAQTITGVKTFNGLALQLASEGSSQPTVLRNSSALSTATVGFNTFGFNQNRHLFFNDGSGFNVGILAYNNTSARTYTLQDANGTLAFTSDITTALNDFVTLDTFQTITAQKNFNSTIVANTNIQLATKGTALTTFLQNISGTQISTSGSNAFGFNNANNIYFAGSAKSGGVFAFDNSTFRTYTLQDASGTLALTSDLNAYLPLTGGTLTGALNGTSASFTGEILISGNIEVGTSNSGLVLSKINIGPKNAIVSDSNGDLLFNSSPSGFNNLIFTGAATFSSSVTAVQASIGYTSAAPTNGMIVQGNVGIGTTAPATSAILDLTSTTGALLLPRMTTTQRDALTAVNGMILYNTTTNTIQGREDGAWVDLSFIIN